MDAVVEVEVAARVPAKTARVSARALAVAGMFGISLEEDARHAEEREVVRIAPGEVVLIAGASGAGKSTLLRGIRRGLEKSRHARVMVLEEINVRQRVALVDCLDVPLEESLRFLAMAGLSEARVLLRSPFELSEGERFRFRLARFMASDVDVLIADEFAATLDRITARVVAWQLGKFIRSSVTSAVPRAAVVATSHDDLEGDLRPAMVIRRES